MIVLVIDEAQHAITTEAGASTLYALKAARDQLNGSAHHGFRLIATGSNRDKLGVLVQGKDQAFLNATLIDLELLGDDYLRWEIDQYDGDFKPSLTVLKAGFHAAGHQPETLRKALNWLVFRSDVTAANVDTLFKQIMGTIMLTAKRDFVRQVNALPPLQAAVLVVMALMGTDYAPFRLHTLQKYQATCALLTNDDLKIDDSTIQYALESLRTKSLIWKSTRGIYAIEDSQHEQWLLEDYAKPIGS